MNQIVSPKLVWLGVLLLLVLQLFFQQINFISFNIILLILASLWLAFSKERQWNFTPLKYGFIALFLLNLSGLGTDAGRFEIEKKLSLILFPLCFSVVTIERKDLLKISKVLFLSCLVGLFFIYGRLGYHYYKTHELLAYHEILEGTGLHPSYCNLYLLTGFFSYAFLIVQNPNKSGYFYVTIISILFSIIPFLALSAAKVQILNYLVCLVLFFLFTRKQISIWVPVGALIVTSLAMVIVIAISPQVQDRMRDFSEAKKEIAPNDTNQTSTSARKYMWQSAVKLIKKNPIFGVGAGNENNALVEEYTAIDFQFGMYHRTDAHNQVLATAVSHGLVGVFALMFVFLYPLTRKRFINEPLFWFFYVPIALTALVESIFGVQKGIVFFCLFFMIFDSIQIESKKTGAQ